MRLATLIISLLLMVILGIQSCGVYGLGDIAGKEELAEGGAVGLFVALLWLIGAAFVIAKPIVSIVSFAAGGMLGFAVGASTPFQDMIIWGTAGLILAGMSFLGYRELKKKEGIENPE